jgi:hypothetical protein
MPADWNDGRAGAESNYSPLHMWGRVLNPPAERISQERNPYSPSQSFPTWPQTEVEEPYRILSEGNVYFRKPQLESQRNTFNFKVKCMKVLCELLRVKYRNNSEEMYRESI